MSPEERISALEQENRALREQLAQRDELITQLQQRLQAQEGRLRKDSHYSLLPSSSDRFVRQPKSLRTKSGKKPGGQPNHPGHSLSLCLKPDEVVVHALWRCQHCEQDLQTIPARAIERRQVVDIPSPALLVVEHQAEQKQCPRCHQISLAPNPEEVRAPLQ